MSLSPGLSKKTNSIIRYDPSSSVDSRFGLQSVVRDYIPGPKTPDTEMNESFHFSPGGTLPIPSTIFYQDVPSPSSELEREPEPEDTLTQLEPAGSSNCVGVSSGSGSRSSSEEGEGEGTSW